VGQGGGVHDAGDGRVVEGAVEWFHYDGAGVEALLDFQGIGIEEFRAFVDEKESVAELLGLVHDMGGEDDGFAYLRASP